MQKNAIGWVEIPVVDLDRAEKFYHDYFGFETTRQVEKDGLETSWLPREDGYGAAGALVQGGVYKPSYTGPVLYFTAPGGSVEKALEKAEEFGVKIIVQKTDLGPHGFIAWIEDSEGNRIGIYAKSG